MEHDLDQLSVKKQSSKCPTTLAKGKAFPLSCLSDLNADNPSRYGFVMYHNYNDAENCIRAFFFLGYEAKFAKVGRNLAGVANSIF